MRSKIMGSASRHRGALWLAVVLVFTSVGSAGATAGAMLHLGVINTASRTTVLNSAVNAAVLQLKNTNTAGGTSAQGLAVNVPAGRPPITVNASAGKATNLNADKLDGLDVFQLMWGDGAVYASWKDLAPGSGPQQLTGGTGSWSLEYECPASLSSNGKLYLANYSGSPMNVFYDYGGASPAYTSTPSGVTQQLFTAASGDWYDIQLHLPAKSDFYEISVFSVHRSADCHVQAQVISNAR